MPLPAEQVYNDLNGQEVKEILIARFADLINNRPEFQRHLTFPRVKLSLMCAIETTFGTFTITNELVARTAQGEEGYKGFQFQHSDTVHQATVDTYSNPPDMVREQHGLPSAVPVRNPVTGYLEDMMVPPAKEAVQYPQPIIPPPTSLPRPIDPNTLAQAPPPPPPPYYGPRPDLIEIGGGDREVELHIHGQSAHQRAPRKQITVTQDRGGPVVTGNHDYQNLVGQGMVGSKNSVIGVSAFTVAKGPGTAGYSEQLGQMLDLTQPEQAVE